MTSTASTRTQPKVIFDILDYIFAFLKTDPQSLIACSNAHPSFSTIAERHIYYYIILATSYPDAVGPGPGYFIKPSRLIKLLSDAPQIVNHVRVLQIGFDWSSKIDEEIALILPMFTALECIALTSTQYMLWWKEGVSEALMKAVENCLCLPTLQEVHIRAMNFPLSMLDRNANLKRLSFSRSFELADCPDDTNPLVQLSSLTFEHIGPEYRTDFTTWAKKHVTNLQSLKCGYSHDGMILRLLEICSGTLTDLNIELESHCETAVVTLSFQDVAMN